MTNHSEELFEKVREIIHKNLSSGWVRPTTQTVLLEFIMKEVNEMVDTVAEVEYNRGYNDGYDNGWSARN